MRRTWVAVALAAALGAACSPRPEEVANGDDPIAALGARVASSRYGPSYWAAQRWLNSDVWRRARAMCAADRARELPNCEPVRANAEAARGQARADSVFRRIGEQAKGRR